MSSFCSSQLTSMGHGYFKVKLFSEAEMPPSKREANIIDDTQMLQALLQIFFMQRPRRALNRSDNLFVTVRRLEV